MKVALWCSFSISTTTIPPPPTHNGWWKSQKSLGRLHDLTQTRAEEQKMWQEAVRERECVCVSSGEHCPSRVVVVVVVGETTKSLCSFMDRMCSSIAPLWSGTWSNHAICSYCSIARERDGQEEEYVYTLYMLLFLFMVYDPCRLTALWGGLRPNPLERHYLRSFWALQNTSSEYV